MKDYLKGDNGSKSIELAYTLLEQTFQGTIPNPQILSYLKYSIRSQLITCSGVFSALTSFKKINQQVLHCLLLIGKLLQKNEHFSKTTFSVKNLLNDLVKNRCDDNVQVLAKSLISLTIWCFNSLHQIILQVNEQPEMWNHQNQNVVLILNILNLICKENKTNCLLYIGRDTLVDLSVFRKETDCQLLV